MFDISTLEIKKELFAGNTIVPQVRAHAERASLKLVTAKEDSFAKIFYSPGKDVSDVEPHSAY